MSSLDNKNNNGANMDDFPTIFDAKTCLRRGLCPVTNLRPQGPPLLESHSLYFEQHGKGKHKILFIMGLNSSCFSWAPQVRHFGASGFKEERKDVQGVDEDIDKDGGYSIIVFDNRGMGNSTTPRGPYSTSGMAADVIELLDYVGWTGEREVNVVGVSLGGMIAQELAFRIPDRIASLILAVTTPGGYLWDTLPPWVGLRSLAKLAFTPEPEKKTETAVALLYTPGWLAEKAVDDPKGRTNAEVEAADFLYRISITRKQQLMGHFSQMVAGLTHHVQPERLRQISRSIPKIVIVTGDEDHLVRVHNSLRLKEAMPEAEMVQFDDTGHGLTRQRRREFNKLVERTIKEGQERLARGWTPETGWA